MNTNFPIHRNNFEQIRDERRTAANTAFRIGNAFLSLLGLIEDSNSDIEEQFLHSQVEDVAEEKITFRKGLQVGNRFTSGLLGEGGIFRKEADGTTYLEADKLYIRIKALFDNVEIRDFKHSAGNRIASPAGMKCCRVEWLDANGDVVQQADANLPQVVRFRCYFRGSDGEDEVRNNFIVGDQAYCHITSVDTKADDPNSKGLNMKHYWRLVVGRNPSGSLTDDGEHWIDLSNQATETLTIDGHTYTHAGYQDGSDIPVAQDDIIQLGNIYDTDRMGAIIEFVTGADAPSYQIFQDINGFDLSGKNYLSLGYSTQTGHAYLNVYGDAYIGDPEGSTYIRYEQGDGTPQHRPSLRIKAHVEFLNSDQELDDLVQNHQRDDSYDDRAIRAMIAGLQDQIDGAIDTWFFNGTPGASVLPESDWKTKDEQSTPISYNERLKHLGDLYYDNQTGYAYRYVNSGSEQSPVFSWSPISDSAVVEALAAAARAQDTADHKRRIFLSTPYPPYDAGDMWVNAVWPASGTSQGSVYNDDILKCINPVPRTGVSAFSIDDWTKASKYTDDSKFNGYINALLNGSGASGDSATAAAVQRAIISAMGGSTVVSGGLMLTSMLALRKLNAGGDPTDLNDYTTWAGINGVYDDTKTTGGIAAWYGGGMKDYETLSAAEKAHGWNTERWAKSLFRFDGSGYVAGGNISWDSAGAVTIQGTTINATNLQKGGSSVLSQAEGDARYITVSFFETLFNAMNSSGQKVSANTTTGIASIKAMFGFWTQQYISALGQGTDGGGGGQGDVTWQLLADPDIRQINLTHLTTALGTLTGYTTSGKNYAVQKDSSNHLYVNVPWTNTVYTLPTASSSTKGGVKVGTTLAISSAVLNLKSDIVTAGTYTKVAVDTYGRVTAGYTLSASDIPDLSWDKITSGTPTTLSGYGITDAKIASGVITLGSNTITPVTSVAMSVPTGFSVSGSPVTKTGTLALTYASGYEGFTTTLKNRINTLWAMFTREGSGTAADPYVIKANYGLYTDSFLSALGQGSDSGGGQGDVTWALLASTATGGRTIDISYITNALTNGGYATQSWVHQQGYTTNIGTVTQVKVGSTAYNPSSGVVSLPAYPSDYWSTQTSRTKNTVLAAPNGSAGAASFRALVAADIPNLAASKITSGTFDSARIPDLSSTYATSARATTLEGYFTDGVAKKARQLVCCYAYDGGNGATNPYHLAGEVTISSTSARNTSAMFLVDSYYGSARGILLVQGRVDSGSSAINTSNTYARWLVKSSSINVNNFILTTKVTSNSLVCRLYYKITAQWYHARFRLLDEGSWADTATNWQLFTTYSDTAGDRIFNTIPSDETQFVSVDDTVAGSANKLVTSRSLWGQSFDGTADISGNISNAGNITPSATASKNLGSDTLMFEYGYIRRLNTQSGYDLRIGAGGTQYIQINASTGAVSVSSAVSMSSTLGVTGATTLTGLLTANGGITIPSGKTLTIGDAVLSWDATNQGIKITKGLYSQTFISALGAGSDSGGGGGQGDVTWTLLADNNDTRQIALSHLTTALGTLTGYTTSGKNYKVQKDSSNHLYVNVPWTDTVYTHPTNGANTTISAANGKVLSAITVNNLGHVTSVSSKTLAAADIPSLAASKITSGTFASERIPDLSGTYATSSRVTTLENYFTDGVAKEAVRFRAGRILSGNTSGDANTMQLDGTGTVYTVLTNYHHNPKWQNMPEFASTYGGVVEIKGADDSLKMQLAWSAIHDETTSPTNGLWFRARANKGYSGTDWHEVAMTDSNVASATKLQTARTLWGQSFDGTGNVDGKMTINYSGASAAELITLKTTNSSYNCISYYKVSDSGYSWSVGVNANSYYIYSGKTTSTVFAIDNDGKVGIGTTSPSYKLHVAGTFYASGNSSIGGTLGVTGATTLTGLLTANGGITIPSGKTLTIGDAVLSWDATNQGIKITKGLYSQTFISALGAGSDSGGGGGQGDVTWALLASTATGGRTIDISYITNALTNGGYATQSWVQQQGYTTNIGTVTQVKVGSTAYNPSSGVVSLPAYPSDYWSTQTSRTKNTVLAAPNGSAGAASFRALVAADIPNLAASKITSGTFSTDRIPDLSSTYATSARATTLEGYFTNGIAKNANKLDNNTSDWYMKRGAAFTQNYNGTYWQKVATCSITSTSTHDAAIMLMVSDAYYCRNNGILGITCRKDQDSSTYRASNTKAFWIARDKDINISNYVLTFKFDSSTNTSVWNLYVKQQYSWQNVRFTMIDEGNWYTKSNLWTLVNANGTNENSYSAIPSDEIQIVSEDYSAASRLATSRSLWGQSFDGTADVSGNMTDVGDIDFAVGNNNRRLRISKNGQITFRASTSGWATYLGAYSNDGTTTLSSIGMYGEADVLTYLYIGGTYSSPQMVVNNSGNVGIGTTSPDTKLHVSGTFKATSNSTIGGTFGVSGATTLSSTLAVTGATTLTGLLTANGNIQTGSSNGAYVQIGAVRLVYDSTNNAIKVVQSDGSTAANFYATGAVSALGAGTDSGGGGGQGDVTWQLLADNNDTRQIALSHITTALSTLTGYTTSGTNYKVQKDSSNHLYVSVPWTNTTYSAGTGLTLSNNQFSVSSANVSTMLNLLSTGSSVPVGDDYYISQSVNGGTTTTTYYRRPVSKLAEYVRSTITAADIPSLSYLPLSGGTLTGAVSIKYDTDSSRVYGLYFNNTSDTTIASVTYHNINQNIVLNPIGSSSPWADDVGKYSLFVGNNKLTYNTYKIWHAGNDGTGSGLDADLLDGQHGSYYATASSVSTLQGYFTDGVAKKARQLVCCYAYDGGNGATNPYHLAGEVTISSTSARNTTAMFLVDSYYGSARGILLVQGSVDSGSSAINTSNTYARWLVKSSSINVNNFILTTKVTSNSLVCRLYYKITAQWYHARFRLLDEGEWAFSATRWQLFNTESDTAGDRIFNTIPSDETQFVSVDDTVAGSANKLVTSRSLWGQSFNGTADISGNISNAGNITPSATASKNLGSDTLMFEYGYIRRINTQSGYDLRIGAGGTQYIQINASTGAVSISSAVSMSSTLSLKSNAYSGDYCINCNNSDIVNVNAIKTSDLADSWDEGLLFARTNGNWDSFWASNGNFYFSSDSGTTLATLNNDGLYLNGTNGWIRTYGSCGWYSQSHGGGWYMTDDTWIRSYGSKYVYINTNLASEHIYAGGGSYNSNYPLYINGVGYASSGFYTAGYVTALSDARHKTIIRNAVISVEQIARMPAVVYRWNDGRGDNGLHVGSIAQDWQRILPEVVTKANDEEGTLSMQYGVAALVSTIITARKVVDHEKRIQELEKENKRLKEMLNVA